MLCASCGRDNREAARFCDECGSRLSIRCPDCGTELRDSARFCDACGRPLLSSTPPAAPAGPAAGPAPGRPAPPAPASYTPRHLAERILSEGRALRGERKEVTVLFADVQGSTELAAALDPEEFHEVMDGMFHIMLDAVHGWEGTVNQFTGDGVMALFGAPIAHEDHAQRAAAAALAMQRNLAGYAARLRRERGLTLQVRIGLNSGPVVVGAIGDDLRMDYTAQGLTTNLAARMQQAADPGSILATAATQRLAEGYFRFRSVGPLRVRGVADPVDAWALDGEGRVTSRLEASLRRGVSPFRGREAELRRLGALWERVLAGEGQTVCLVGDPGIGKSRLALEFQRSLGLEDHVEGAALAHTRGVAYSVFRSLLRGLAGIPAGADLAVARDLLHRRLWDLSPALAAHVPSILAVLGTAPDAGSAAPDDRRDQLRAAVQQWIAAECGRAPRILVVEDLQWLDPSSENLLHHLAAGAGRLPLLILTTSRLPLAGSGLEQTAAHEIRLPALSPLDIRGLVDAQVEPYPAGEPLHRLVAARAEGNPFYAEEIVRTFREQGLLSLQGGRYELREGADPALPATITALIAARVDRLPAPARELVTDAATLGVHFPLALLRALAASESFDEHLALLERRGLLERTGAGPDAPVAFRHVLTHEVVYAGMLQAERRGRHRRAALAFEALYQGHADEVCDRLAHHWAASDERVRAWPYLLAAADAAVAIGANREAIAHLEAALELAAQHPEAASPPVLAGVRLKLASLLFIIDER